MVVDVDRRGGVEKWRRTIASQRDAGVAHERAPSTHGRRTIVALCPRILGRTDAHERHGKDSHTTDEVARAAVRAGGFDPEQAPPMLHPACALTTKENGSHG